MRMRRAIQMRQFSVVRGSKEEPLWNEEELSKSCKQGCRKKPGQMMLDSGVQDPLD